MFVVFCRRAKYVKAIVGGTIVALGILHSAGMCHGSLGGSSILVSSRGEAPSSRLHVAALRRPLTAYPITNPFTWMTTNR
jgi:hypothetical protein